MDAQGRWVIQLNILYFTDAEDVQRWLTNGWLTIMDAQQREWWKLPH